MASFAVKSRVKGAITLATVEAETREDAVMQTTAAAAEGEEVEVMDVKELPGGTSGGATGATGTARVAGPVAPGVKPTRAQLNDMTKEELLEVAEKEGAEGNQSWNKADIVDSIIKHQHR